MNIQINFLCKFDFIIDSFLIKKRRNLPNGSDSVSQGVLGYI